MPLKQYVEYIALHNVCMNFQKFLKQKYVIPILPKGKDTTY